MDFKYPASRSPLAPQKLFIPVEQSPPPTKKRFALWCGLIGLPFLIVWLSNHMHTPHPPFFLVPLIPISFIFSLTLLPRKRPQATGTKFRIGSFGDVSILIGIIGITGVFFYFLFEEPDTLGMVIKGMARFFTNAITLFSFWLMVIGNVYQNYFSKE